MQPAGHPPLRTVQTEDGVISVASLEILQQDADEMARQIANLLAQTPIEEAKAAATKVKAGWLLTGGPTGWQPGDRATLVEAARGLGQQVTSIEQSITDVHACPHHGLGGLIQSAKDSHESKGLEEQLKSAQVELDQRYRAVVDHLAPTTGIPEVDALLVEAGQAEARVRDLADTHAAVSIELQRVTDEIKRRNEVKSKLGFDALGLEADLMVNGIRPIQTSLVLKPKEIAAAEVPATLCRFKTKTEFVGGSHGVSIPLGHGFRYRVSSYRGHPVQSQYLAHLDTGKLIVTNKRLVFIGAQREVSTAIPKLLQIEPYSDAVGIAREGKESKDVYLVPNPAYVVQLVQWMISQQDQA